MSRAGEYWTHSCSTSFPCEECGKVYHNKNSLGVHRHREHRQSGQKNTGTTSFSCEECGKICHNKNSLYIHRHRHKKAGQKYTCDECGKQFDLEDSFKKHLRVHQPMTQCPQCGKMVRNIRQHISISHTEDDQKRVQCQDCGKGFARKDYLDKHIMNVHLKLRPHKCRYEGCDMSYNDYSNRDQH